MGIIVGSLAGQNWHRQAWMQGLDEPAKFAYVFEKTAAIGRQFGFNPISIDASVAVIGTDPGYLNELKARLQANNMIIRVGFGQVAISNDAWVREQSLKQAQRGLEVAARMGSVVSTFSCARNGRVSREGQLQIAGRMLAEVGHIAADLGLRICQENFDYWRSDELVRLCQASGRSNVGIQSDTGNWLITGENPVDATARCLPYTFHSHVRDYLFENLTYNGVAVGAGLIDFERILPLLATRGETDDFVFSVEVDTDDRDEDACAQESFAFVKDWLIRHGQTTHLVL